MKFKSALLILSICFVNVFSNESLFSKDRLCQFIDTLELQFSTSYAPLSWKRESLHVDFNAQAQATKDKIRKSKTLSLKQYQGLIRDLLNSVHDYHVSFSFNSTEYAMLPFQIEGAEGRYFISEIDFFADYKFLEKAAIGDEILKVNGKPIKDLIEALKLELMASNPQTDEAFAQFFFSLRFGALGMDVPHGKITLELLDAETGKKKLTSTEWEYQEELVSDPPYKIKAKRRPKSNIFKPLMLSGYASILKNLKQTPRLKGINMLGEREGFLPKLGEPTWTTSSSDPFDAYIYTNAQGFHIGYIRIPDFLPEDCYENMQEFKELVKEMEIQTDALIIDVLNNPGGYAQYMYAMISTLIQQPFVAPKERITITQEDVLMAMEILDYIDFVLDVPFLLDSYIEDLSKEDGFDYEKENIETMLEYSYFILDQWNRGKILTDPIHQPTIKTIKPNKNIVYTKPLYVLVNGLSISCGDFFPAVLQDAGRATIIGSRTAGAGGYIDTMQFSNVYGLNEVVYTKSVAERTNKKKEKIENTGVTPDVIYETTVDDLKNAHRGFIKAINSTIEKDLSP